MKDSKKEKLKELKKEDRKIKKGSGGRKKSRKNLKRLCGLPWAAVLSWLWQAMPELDFIIRINFIREP